jgi:hypothetical protein
MIDQPPSAPQRGTGLAFVQHWDWVADKGLMPRNTAMGVRAAVSQILKIEDGWESIDVRNIDLDNLLARFRNLSDLSPGSLATYESRFRSGWASYLAYLDSPTTYQPKARKQPPQHEPSRQSKRGRIGPSDPSGASSEDIQETGSNQPLSPPSVRLVVYPFPVRPDVFAELKLPANLSADEAERLSTFLRALALGSEQ